MLILVVTHLVALHGGMRCELIGARVVAKQKCAHSSNTGKAHMHGGAEGSRAPAAPGGAVTGFGAMPAWATVLHIKGMAVVQCTAYP